MTSVSINEGTPAVPSEDIHGHAAPTSSRSCQLPPPVQPHWRRAAGRLGRLGAQPPSLFQTRSPLCHQPSLEPPLGKWSLQHQLPPIKATAGKSVQLVERGEKREPSSTTMNVIQLPWGSVYHYIITCKHEFGLIWGVQKRCWHWRGPVRN